MCFSSDFFSGSVGIKKKPPTTAAAATATVVDDDDEISIGSFCFATLPLQPTGVDPFWALQAQTTHVIIF